MKINFYLITILFILTAQYVLELAVEGLNLSSVSASLPGEFKGFYDADKYKKSQLYLKDNTRFELIKNGFFTVITIGFILAGGFDFIDRIARGLNLGPVLTGLIFSAIIVLGLKLLNIPFLCCRTFILEQKYGFNKTTLKTFILDIIKALILTLVIGGAALSIILWFFAAAGSLAWLYCWVAIALFQLFLLFIAPAVILPLFNKFMPLEDGELKQAIEQFARQQNFKLQGIFRVDASRRSTKANAYFTGFGRYRRIALFDTLIAEHTTDELVSVLAHEIGHYKKRHFVKQIICSLLTTGIMSYILSLFIENPYLFAAFKMGQTSIYASIFFFGFLYMPINMVFSILGNILSRRHEYQADSFAVKTCNKPQAFIDALKKLTVSNLSNLTPHPLKVFLEYSHPPILKRIQVLRRTKPFCPPQGWTNPTCRR